MPKVRIKDLEHIKKEVKSRQANYYPEIFFKIWKTPNGGFYTTELQNKNDKEHLRRGYLGINRNDLYWYMVGLADALEVLSYDRTPTYLEGK